MVQLIAIFVGAVIGAAASGGGFGLVVGAALGWLLVRVMRQQKEIDALRGSVEAYRRVAAVAPAPLSADMPSPVQTTAMVSSPLPAEPIVPAAKIDRDEA